MNRKKFLASAAATAAAFLPPGIAAASKTLGEDSSGIIPPYLEKGDCIGITSPAGYILLDAIKPAIQQIEGWGFRVKVGSCIGKRDFTFGGTDEERAADFQQMLDDPSIKAILCARGGYGAVRLVDRINWKGLPAQPKWIIGFSDITVIHAHLSRTVGLASVHSKMCNSFPDVWEKADAIQMDTIRSIRDAISGIKMEYRVLPNAANRKGRARGRLIGGNLKTIESLTGSASDIRTNGKLLFVEDTGEYLYSIDRMFWNLKRSGKLEQLAGLIVGGFKVKTDDPGDEFGRNLQDIVLEVTKPYSFPVCFDFPVGHQKNNFALKCGVEHRLQVGPEEVLLSEVTGR